MLLHRPCAESPSHVASAVSRTFLLAGWCACVRGWICCAVHPLRKTDKEAFQILFFNTCRQVDDDLVGCRQRCISQQSEQIGNRHLSCRFWVKRQAASYVKHMFGTALTCSPRWCSTKVEMRSRQAEPASLRCNLVSCLRRSGSGYGVRYGFGPAQPSTTAWCRGKNQPLKIILCVCVCACI